MGKITGKNDEKTKTIKKNNNIEEAKFYSRKK